MRAISDLLHELEGLGIQVAVNGDKLKLTGVRDVLTVELRQELAANKPAIMAVLRQQKGKDDVIANVFVQQIQQAKHWCDLDKLLEAVEAAYLRGEIDQAMAEALAQQAAQWAKEVPEQVSDTYDICVSTLLSKKKLNKACFACGTDHFWTKSSGQLVCSVCHPEPSVKKKIDSDILPPH